MHEVSFIMLPPVAYLGQGAYEVPLLWYCLQSGIQATPDYHNAWLANQLTTDLQSLKSQSKHRVVQTMCHYAELDIPGAFSLGVGQLYRVGMTPLLSGHSVVCRHAIPIFTGTYGKGLNMFHQGKSAKQSVA